MQHGCTFRISQQKDDLVAGNEIKECFTFVTGSDCLSDPPPTCQRPGKKMAHDDGNFRATGSAYDDLICCLVSPGSQPLAIGSSARRHFPPYKTLPNELSTL
jgi:hypothetical protein